MALPSFNMRQLLEAGVHFGHQTHRWNPKMAPYIFGTRNKIHIIDLAQAVPLLHQALVVVSDTVAQGGRVLFVGTKRQAADAIADAARRSAQYYVNHRWLGGTLTNWKTISNSIKRLRALEELLGGEGQGLTKKEMLNLTRERDKLERALGGIKDMGGVPDVLFVIDTNKEAIAIAEARKLSLPVIAIVDTNCDPTVIDYPIPGNDDAARAITLYCDLMAKAVIEGIERAQGAAGIDIGAAEEPVEEAIPETADAAGGAGEEAGEPQPVETEQVEPAPRAAKAAGEGDSEAPTAGEVQPFAKPDGVPDDLKKIAGVGPVLEQKLNAFGIYQYAQIANLKKADIARIDEALNFKGRIERDEWIKQAKALMKGVG